MTGRVTGTTPPHATPPHAAPLNASDPPGRWAALGVLASALLLPMTTWFAATAVVPALRRQWQLSAVEVSLLTISVQLGFVVGAVTSAAVNLPDRAGPRRLMLLGSLGAAVSTAGLLVAGGAAAAIPLRAVTGACLALVYPPALKVLATWFRRGRGTALGVLVGALTLGSATPHLVDAVGGADWRLVLAVPSLLAAAGGLLAELVGRDGPYPFPRGVFDPRQSGAVLLDRGVRLATAGYLGHQWELYAMWAWAGAFASDALARHGSATPGRTGAYATAAVIGVGTVGCWAGGVLGDRWGRTRLAALAMGISGSCAVAIGLLRDAPLWLLLLVGLVWGVSVIADSAQFSAMVTEVADQAYVGTALTLQMAAGFALTVLTIYLVPVLRDAWTWTWAFAVLAPGPALGVWAMLRLRRSPQATRIAGGRG